MRVDIGAEFYVRVKPDASSIALAAQTLGSRTNNAGELRELIEAKFVDGLRSVRRHHEPRGAAGAARDLRQVGAGRGRRRHPEQRPRARIGVADAARPERHQAFQPEQFLRRPRSDDADQDHQGTRAGAQPDRPHHRGEHRPAGPRRPPDHADDRSHQARGGTGAAARHRQQDRRDARARPRRSNRPPCRTRPNTASSRNWRSPTSRPKPTRRATRERSRPISR